MDSTNFCARIISEKDVPAWHELRREMALFDLEAARSALASCSLTVPTRRPYLLFGEEDVATIRTRANDDVRDTIRQQCDKCIADPPEDVGGRNAFYLATPAMIVAGGLLVLEDERYADWARKRIEALLSLPTWMGEVHKSFCPNCDHVMANVGATLTCAHDLLGDAVDSDFTDRVCDGIKRLLVDPYLVAARSRGEFWSRDVYLGNWKIMTHGESGLAVCAFADRWPEAREALTLAAEGVLDILDAIPPEGDWPEGVGYWYATLFLGLRFALALRRLTAGAVDLLQHPRMNVTGDFGSALISPAGRVYNFGDNQGVLSSRCSEALLMLGVEQGRADWVAAARHFPSYSPLWLHLDDPAIESKAPGDGAVRFSATGAGAMRLGSTFVGMHSGDSTVGHAHLDNNSFVLETRGKTLLRDSGYWPYAHFLGFFECGHGYGGPRWNFDGVATIAHNAILVDGQGQAYGAEYRGVLESADNGNGWMFLHADASECYPGLLTKWKRSLLLVGEGALIIRDLIVCDGERHVEWLLQSDAELTDDGDDTCLRLDGVQARLVPLLPDRTNGWRVSDVVRRSVFENSNTGDIERPAICYRSFAPFRAAESFEFLFVLKLVEMDHKFVTERDTWQIELPSAHLTVRPEGDKVTIRA